MSNENAGFETLEELSKILEQIGLNLHKKNRLNVESEFLWQLAETIRKSALLAQLFSSGPELDDIFGSGHKMGTIDEDHMEQEFLALLRKQKT